MKRFAIATILAAGAAANAQSFNVDFNAGSGAGAGIPMMAFKGAAGQSGNWNGVGTQTSWTLVGLNGVPSAVTLTRSGGGSIVNNSTGALSGDDEKLLEDAFLGSGALTYSFNNLQAATYAVYTYAIDPSSWAPSTVNVAGSTSQADQDVGTFLSGPNYFVGATHALHVVTVTAGGSVSITISEASVVAGIQLVRLPASLLRIHVEDTATGAHTGATWADAFTNPVTALRTARAAGGQNCEVWVANGFYKPTTTTDRWASFDIPSRLKFYGGFSGSETSVDQRGLNLCYLNGNIGDPGSNTDNCLYVIDAELTASDTLIDGFRIHNGYNDVTGMGAGMHLLSGSPTVRNCTFVDNFATDAGGGVYAYNSAATFVDCDFNSNEASAGAGLYHTGEQQIRLYNCRFMNNYAYEGSLHFDDSDGLVANSVFNGNVATGSGGAIYASGHGSFVRISYCTIAGNWASYVVGGVMVNAGADVMIHSSILWANLDQESSSQIDEQYDLFGVGSMVTIDATTVQGAAGTNGLNPLFVDGDGPDNSWGNFDDDCRLQAASPCINAGEYEDLPTDQGDLDLDGNTAERLPFDFNGQTRVRDGVADRGAYEFQPACALDGDLDGNGDVDLADLATLLSNFGTLSGASHADGDTDSDADVDLADLSLLLSDFGQSCP